MKISSESCVKARTTVFVTHDRSEAMQLGDRVAVMIDGSLAQVGEPGDVFSSPADEKVAGFVGVENLIPGRVLEQWEGLATVELRHAIAEVVSDAPVGQRVLACLRPEDGRCSASIGHPDHLGPQQAARSHRAIAPAGSQVRLRVDCGFPLVAVITRRSSEELGLGEGSEVLVSFKASSVHLLSR